MTDTKVRYEPKAGDIFYSSWGYDQSNIDFYEVVSVTPTSKSVRVRAIGKQLADDGRNVVPRPGSNPNGKLQTKRLNRWEWHNEEHVTFYVASYANATLWDGRPLYDTCAAGQPGH